MIQKQINILAVVFALCAIPAFGQSVGKDARVNLRVEQRSLAEVVDYLREQTGANLVLLPAVPDYPPISLQLTDVPWRDALEIAAESAGGVVSERTGGILVVERPARVTYETTEPTDITKVIDLIGKLAGANIVVAPEVTGSISLRLKDVPWRDALDVTVKTLGFSVIEENRGILRVVDPVTLQAQMVTRSYLLRYIRPKSRFKPHIKSEFLQPLPVMQAKVDDLSKTFSVLDALKKALSSGGELDYVEAQNVIIVRDTAQVHDEVKQMIDRLDVEPAQVFVDIKFVSTLNSDFLDLGVDYGDAGPRASISGGQIPTTLPFGLYGGDWEDSLGAVSKLGHQAPVLDSTTELLGAFQVPDTIFGALSFTGVQATLKMLQRDTKADVIQAPKLIALDGTEATIFVGETIRYAEAKSEQGQAGGFQLSLTEAAGSPVDIGFQLLIVPHVIAGTNSLTMEVIPKETSLSGVGQSALAPAGFDVFTIGALGEEGTIALPRTRSSTIVTHMLLESGQTAVIGGLTTDSETRSESEVPYLADIPLIGELFQYKKNERTRRSLLVCLTPTIVHSSADTETILQNELLRRRMRLKDQVAELMSPATKAAIDAQRKAEKADADGD